MGLILIPRQGLRINDHFLADTSTIFPYSRIYRHWNTLGPMYVQPCTHPTDLGGVALPQTAFLSLPNCQTVSVVILCHAVYMDDLEFHLSFLMYPINNITEYIFYMVMVYLGSLKFQGAVTTALWVLQTHAITVNIVQNFILSLAIFNPSSYQIIQFSQLVF